MTQSTRHKPHLRLVIIVAACLFSGLILAGLYLNLVVQRYAEQHTHERGQVLAEQTAALIKPAILANDPVSLNYQLNQLVRQDYIDAISVSTPQDRLLARAGDANGLDTLVRQINITQQGESLAHLTLTLNPQMQRNQLSSVLLQALILALIISILSLLLIWQLQPKPATEQQLDPEDIDRRLAESAAQAKARKETTGQEAVLQQPEVQQQAPQQQPVLQTQPVAPVPIESQPELFTDPPVTTSPLTAQPVNPAGDPLLELAQLSSTAPLVTTPAATAETVNTDIIQPQVIQSQVIAQPVEPMTQPLQVSEQPLTATHAQQIPVAEPVSADTSGMLQRTPDSLVELLRPAEHQPSMPGFVPSEPQPATAPVNRTAAAQQPVIEELEIQPLEQSSDTTEAASRTSILKNPLFNQESHEVQLDLYAFEQELEMIVNAEEAGYLLYLDLTSGHAENLTVSELEQTQHYYTKMLEMVIAIYQGEITKLSNGDLQLAFLRPNPEDAHGINAICASQLFNRLYKAFNQQRIRRMQPVLNLHMAIVRGHYRKLPRLQEEARYLTRSTDSNELISHTALSEAPDLKISLLAGADIQRSDEDKVLLMAVNESYQKLLDKQAQHLLKKLPF